jgi:hypothetical protein
MTIFGIDYAWGRPGVAALKSNGVKFVARYLSHDTTGKNLTKTEAKQLSDAGISLVVVWESTAERPLAGHAAGVADAKAAAGQAKSCGMPDGRPIYFAADWDATEGQQDEINAYLDGAASVLGRGRVGLYGGYWPIKRAFDADKISYGWQTYAWSGGRWDRRAQIQQYKNDQRINGVGVDYDRTTVSDYGQWRVGVTPEEEDMTVTDEDALKIAKLVWSGKGMDVLTAPGLQAGETFPAAPDPDNETWYPASFTRQAIQGIWWLGAKLDTLAKQSGVDVDEDAIAKAVLAGLSPAAIAAAVVDVLPADLAAQVVSEIGDRLAQPGVQVGAGEEGTSDAG